MLARLERALIKFGAICIALIFLMTLGQFILRYGFGRTYLFTEEVARFFLVWATLVGVAVEVRRGGHIRVPIVVELLPASIRRICELTVDLLVLALFLVLVWLGINSTVFNHGQESPAAQIPLSIPFSAMPIFFGISAVFAAERVARYWKRQT